IMPEVWVRYVHAPRQPLDVLLTPQSGDSPCRLAGRLAKRLVSGGKSEDDIWAEHDIAYSSSSLVVRGTFQELACVIVPMTKWWSELSEDARDYFTLRGKIKELAVKNMSLAEIIVDASRLMKRSAWDFIRFCALAGFVALAEEYDTQVENAERQQKAAPKASLERDAGQLKADLEDNLTEFMKDLSDGKTPIAKVTE